MYTNRQGLVELALVTSWLLVLGACAEPSSGAGGPLTSQATAHAGSTGATPAQVGSDPVAESNEGTVQSAVVPSVSGGPNQPNAAPETNYPLLTGLHVGPKFPQQPSSGQLDLSVTVPGTSLGVTYSLALVSAFPHCVDVHRGPSLTSVGLWSCNDGDGQHWSLRSDQTLRPAFDSSMCMAGEAATDPTVPSKVTLSRCSGAKAQKWQVSNFSVKNLSTNLCVEAGTTVVENDGLSFQQLTMVPCDVRNNYARWAFGGKTAGIDAWNRLSRNFFPSVAERCQYPVSIVGAESQDAAVKYLMNLYGGASGLAQFAQRTTQEDCAQIFAQGKDVPPIRLLMLNLLAPDGAASAESMGLIRRINVNSTYFANVDEKQMPRKFRLDSMFHHEVAHTLDGTVELPSGMTEGFANLISYRTGYVSDLQKVKGGKWTDGYSTASFFLDWLDVSYSPQPLGLRFSDQMIKVGTNQRFTQDDPNWFVSWTKKQTGKTIDELWTLYQASFEP